MSEVLQIGGRAGRYGSEFPTGEVTCLEASANEDDVDFLREALKSKPTAIEQAGLTPEFSAIQQLSEAIPNLDYHEGTLLPIAFVAVETNELNTLVRFRSHQAVSASFHAGRALLHDC